MCGRAVRTISHLEHCLLMLNATAMPKVVHAVGGGCGRSSITMGTQSALPLGFEVFLHGLADAGVELAGRLACLLALVLH